PGDGAAHDRDVRLLRALPAVQDGQRDQPPSSQEPAEPRPRRAAPVPDLRTVGLVRDVQVPAGGRRDGPKRRRHAGGHHDPVPALRLLRTPHRLLHGPPGRAQQALGHPPPAARLDVMLDCRWRFAGRLPYGEALALQKETVRRRVAKEIPDTLILIEHPPVITMGKMSKKEHLLGIRPDVEVVETPRGGDVTYHGPGQVVGYPIIDLTVSKVDLKKYLGKLE